MNLIAFSMGSVALLIHLYAENYAQKDLKSTLQDLESDLGLPKISEYDYIIVGGGTAGCLLAARLSLKYHVLLLELGGDPVPPTWNPLFVNDVWQHPEINTGFQSIPQANFALDKGGVETWWEGKMLGGSGSHNRNLYNRGAPQIYDEWAKITGDNSWSYKEMVHHYKRIENFVGILINETERFEYYGHGGPFQVETATPPYLQTWLNAGKELGYPSADPNAHQIESFTPLQASTRNGVKESSYTAFIRPIINYVPTLKVLRYSNVDQVLLKDKKAYGVRYLRHGMPQIAHARREVIISAGALASPLILLKSGIGPKKVLEDAGIPLVMDLFGVGKNLQDHPVVSLSFFGDGSGEKALTEKEFQDALKKFHSHPRSGVLLRAAGPQAFIRSSRAREEGPSSPPDLHFSLLGNPVNDTVLGFRVGFTRPRSRGEIWFNATAIRNGITSPLEQIGRPDFRYFEDPSDLSAMVEGIRFAFKVMEGTESFKARGMRYTDPPLSSCSSLPQNSSEYWACYIKRKAYSLAHTSGTCAMGKETDENAVLDAKLRVKGIQGLRVVDASVLPIVPNSNTNAPVIAVAEKIAWEMLHDK